ncbi:MAG: hypothetical protein ACOX2Z_00620 [Minisyncoccales bacterium]|jgi:hypothetical protein
MNKKAIKIALAVLIVLLLVGAWVWFRNSYSKEVLKLEILAPSEAEAGEETIYTVRYKNNGNTRLEEPKLTFEYPEASIMIDDWEDTDDVIVRSDRKVEMSLEDIQPGEERSREFRAVVFGIDNATIQATARLEYKPRNLNVRYESETSHTLKVSGVPLTFEINLPSRVEPGSEFSFDINYFSRMEYPLTNLRVRVAYPKEFKYVKSRPSPSFDESEWEVGVLNRGQGGRIEVSGIIKDSSMQAKTFEATLGFWQDEKFIPLKKSVRGIELATPPISITSRVNERSNYSASTGEYLHYEITFMNTGDDLLENLFLTVKLDESVIDFDTVQVDKGSFQKNSGTILWDSNEVSGLRFLPTMEEGRVSFWVKVKDRIEGINPAIRAEISLSNVKERVTTKINSRVSLTQKGYFSTGPFDNYGSQPPSVGSSTSYTVLWRVNNLHNELENSKVRAVLAPGVRLSGEVSPKGDYLSFDLGSREIIWDIGRLSAGETSEIYFQIVFDPQPDQKDDSVELISEATLSAKDLWTGSMIYSGYRGIDTTLPDDSSISSEMGIIQ